MARAQLWLINPFGGEPWPLTSFPRTHFDFEWIDTTLSSLAAQEDPSFLRIDKRNGTAIVVEDESTNLLFVCLSSQSRRNKQFDYRKCRSDRGFCNF